MEFKVTAVDPQSGVFKTFFYDNETSSLKDVDGKDIVPVIQAASGFTAAAVSKDTPLGKTSPKILKISLGLSCNYECEYCSQRFVPRAAETNPGDVNAFVADLDNWVKTDPEKIEFWGGEPFVYIKTMRPLAEALRVKYPNTRFTVITNGSMLNAELNEWLYNMGFEVGISHDGPGQEVRGPDPLKDPVQREAILALYRKLAPEGRISFNAMLNRKNISRDEISRFFVELTGDKNVPIGEGGIVDAYDEGGVESSLRPEDAARYRNLAFAEIRTGRASQFQVIKMKVATFVNGIRTRRPASVVGQKCSMDKEDQIAVDLRGNVLTCQNVSSESVAPNGESHKIGHVSNLDAVKLNTATHWSHRSECPKCPMLQICQGACMFLEGNLWETTCNNAYSDAVPIFAAGIEFLTGFAPIMIEGPHRADRHAIWAPPVPKQKVIPIVPVGEANV
jgi:uncharacterized protein